MARQNSKIDFAHKGIGQVLLHQRLRVPPNQREYSWEEKHVRALLEDFANAIARGPVTYFLGTIVLTSSENDSVPEVADGQQRLATTTMILAAIRDHFHVVGQTKRAQSLENYLGEIDTATEETVPKLRLNIDDADFFVSHVVLKADDPKRAAALITKQSKESHRRISEAAEIVRTYIAALLAQRSETAHADLLVQWKDFITSDAQVIQLIVPDHLNAFMMFETLNDRGLRASEADLLKNYLFQLAGDRIQEAHQRWAKMLGILESLGREEIVMDYLRHTTICEFGPTTAKDVYAKMKAAITSKARAMEFLDELASGAAEYSALFNPAHTIWNNYAPSARGDLRTLLELRVEQIRAFMLAVLRHFSVPETEKAMRLFVSWSVRFLVAGGGRGGVLDEAYGQLAAAVTRGEIEDALTLREEMRNTVPSDAAFEAAFAEARVSQAHLARYYLRALEKTAKGEPEPEWVPNEDGTINLEHVMPLNPGDGWLIEPELADAYYKRLGNMVLLPAKKNVALGNKAFTVKQPVLLQSGYVLTTEAGEQKQWGVAEISLRQKRLAELAVQTWPLATAKPTKGGKLPKTKTA
jgi:Protein of unknown function DUF262/Protein of unknown function (DUF1524)